MNILKSYGKKLFSTFIVIFVLWQMFAQAAPITGPPSFGIYSTEEGKVKSPRPNSVLHIPLANHSTSGRMSKEDKLKLDKRFKGQQYGSYVRTTAAYHAIRALDLPIYPNTSTANATVFGFGDTSVPTYGRSQAYDDDFGWQWAKTLQRIDYTYERAAGLGAKVMKTAAHFNTHDPLSDLGGTLTLDGSEGWEGVDRAIAVARKYGMKLTLYPAAPKPGTLELWGMGSSYNYRTMMDNWWLPYVEYMATRYANDYDVVQIQPINEMQTIVSSVDYAGFQSEIYDAVKAIAPNLPVIASGFYHVIGGMPYGQTVMGFLDALNTAGKLNKIDLCVDVHLYPSQDLIKQYGRANIGPYVTEGAGGPQDVVDIIAKLDAYSLPNIKVRIGEFGTFQIDGWYGSAMTEVETANDLTATWNYYKNNSRIDALMFWVTWGLEVDKPAQQIPGIGGIVGQPGMGIWVDNTDLSITKPAASASRSILIYDEYGNPIEADKEWGSAVSTNLLTQTTSYGDVNRAVQRRANGTSGKPTAILFNDILSNIGFRGHDGANFSTTNRVILQGRATETYTPTSQGTRMELATTQNGTVAASVRMIIGEDGNVGIGNNMVASGAMLDVNGAIKSRTGFIFPDATTQTTAVKSFPNSIANFIQLSNGVGGFISDSGFFYSLNKLTSEDLVLSVADPTFLTDDYTTTGVKTAPSSTVFVGLSDRVPVLTSDYVAFSDGTKYAGDAALQWNNTTKRLGIGSAATTGQLEINASTNILAQGRVTNTDAVGTAALAQWLAKSDSAQIQIISHGTGRIATRYGITLGGWNELQAGTGNGLLIGTSTAATPIIFGTNSTERMRISSGGFIGITLGSSVASAATITPTGPIFHVTGVTTINTINVPYTGFIGQITIIPDGIFATSTSGNISLASTSVVNKALIMTYDGTKWYPSY